MWCLCVHLVVGVTALLRCMLCGEPVMARLWRCSHCDVIHWPFPAVGGLWWHMWSTCDQPVITGVNMQMLLWCVWLHCWINSSFWRWPWFMGFISTGVRSSLVSFSVVIMTAKHSLSVDHQASLVAWLTVYLQMVGQFFFPKSFFCLSSGVFSFPLFLRWQSEQDHHSVGDWP